MLAALLGLHRCHPTDAGFALERLDERISVFQKALKLGANAVPYPNHNRKKKEKK